VIQSWLSLFWRNFSKDGISLGWMKKIIYQDPPAQLFPRKDPEEDGGDTTMQIDERELEDIDLDKLEEALNRKELQSIPLEQLRKVHKVFIDSTTGATSHLGIHLEPDPDPKRTRRRVSDGDTKWPNN
jgi:hypothetical protein